MFVFKWWTCIARPTLTDINAVELRFYHFINVLEIIKKTNYINVRAINIIANKYEAKTMAEQISWDCKCKFNNTKYNSNQKWKIEACQCECKNYHKC